ncbi:hypothetical protein VN97_g9475 [Penicillium thymicola]|uniref:Uncharacterized protein n=1 Tax=Penicillium thymicola TaxID=293382 RepID=A0AAI9X567_PENTH|nr:hypothetical protein VN97_g9475 [Penicillium thymicola]
MTIDYSRAPFDYSFNLARTVTTNVSLLIFFFGSFVYNDSHDLRSGSATTVLAPNHAVPFVYIPESCLSQGGYLFFSILRPGCLAFPKAPQSLEQPTRKRERKVNPQTDWVYQPPLGFFCSVSIIYTIPPPPYTKPTSRCTP